MCRNGFIYFPEFCRYAAMAVRCEMLVGVLLNADDEGDDDDDGDDDGGDDGDGRVIIGTSAMLKGRPRADAS